MIRGALHTDQPWNFRRDLTARSDCKIRVQDSEMYAYLTRGNLGLPPEKKSWLSTHLLRGRETAAEKGSTGLRESTRERLVRKAAKSRSQIRLCGRQVNEQHS